MVQDNKGESAVEIDRRIEQINNAHFDKAAFNNPDDLEQKKARARMRERLLKKNGLDQLISADDIED